MQSVNSVYLIVLAIMGTNVCLSTSMFVIHPDNATVLLGENATFNCDTDSSYDTPVWIVEVETDILDSTNFNDGDKFEARGIIVDGSVLTVSGTNENNNTIVHCRVLRIFDGTIHSNKGTLKILGPPSPPEPVLAPVNSTVLQVQWDTPFTWENYTITHYNVVIENRTDNTLKSYTVNSTRFDIHNSDDGGCHMLVVNVSADSDKGQGEAGSVSGGFPKAPDPFEFIDCSNCKVTFLKDGTPLFNTKFELPPVCPYQTSKYQAWLVSQDFPDDKELLLSANYTSSDTHVPVPVVVDFGLKLNATYSIVVMVTTCHGAAVNNITFSTEFIPLITNSLTGMPGENQVILVAGVIAGVVIVAVVILVIIGVLYKRRKQTGVSEVSLDKMFTSGHHIQGGEHYHQPDTANCTYETIDGYQGENLKRFIHVPSPKPSPNIPRSAPSLLPRKDQYTTPETVVMLPPPDNTNKNGETESVTYLQLVSRENSSENCSKSGVDPEVKSTGSGVDNEQYTAMRSVSLRNQTNVNVSAVNRLAVESQGFNEDNYMVFMEP